MQRILILIFVSLSFQMIYGQGLTIQSGSQIVVNGDAAIVLNEGKFTNNGTFAAGNGAVHMKGNGSSSSTSIGGTSTSRFYQLHINKSSNGVQLANDIEVSDTLHVIQGNVDLNGKMVDLVGNGVLAENGNHCVFGTSGEIFKTLALNAPTNENVGGMGMTLTSTDNLGTVTIRRGHQAQSINGGNSINRYFRLSHGGTNVTADVAIQYMDGELNGITENYLQSWAKETDTWKQRTATSLNTSTNVLTFNNTNLADTIWTLSTGMLDIASKVLLQGNYVSGGVMNDDLRTAGHLPTTQPFTGLGFTLVNCNCEPTTQAVLDITGSNAIVDWVLFEVRDKNNKDNVLQSITGLLQKDGDVVDVDGVSSIKIPNLTEDAYYIAIKHRNHYGVLSANTMQLTPTNSSYDFTSSLANTFGGNNGIRATGDGFFVMYSGDVDSNGQINNTDRAAQISELATSGYKKGDINLDGQVTNAELNNILIPNLAKGAPFAY